MYRHTSRSGLMLASCTSILVVTSLSLCHDIASSSSSLSALVQSDKSCSYYLDIPAQSWFLSRRRGSAHGATHAAGNRPPRSPHVMCVHCRDLTARASPRALQRPRVLHRLMLLHTRRGAAAGGPQLRKRCPPSARPPPEADLGPTHSGHVDSHKRAGLVVTMQPVSPGPR